MNDLAHLIEANAWERWKLLGRAPGCTLYDGDHLRLVSPYYNRVARARFDEAEADARIAAVLDELRERTFVWQVGPSSRPADLGARLLAHGLTQDNAEPGMALELDQLREDVPYHRTVAIRRAASLADLEAFEDVQVAGWERPWRRRNILQALFGTLGWEQPDLDHLRPYVGWLGSEPVAAALCLRAAGVAGLYAVGTVPAYRRQGLGTALTLHALREARADGYRIAVLYASKMGYPIYRRLGFQVYCTMEEYVWRGKEA